MLTLSGGCMNALKDYLKEHNGSISDEMALYLAELDLIERVSPEAASLVVKELRDQNRNLKLIASENFSSLSVQAAMGNLLTDKYAEGYPYHRFYAGCDNIDEIEAEAVETAKRLFGAEHAYMQPHSGADANLCAYWAILSTRVEVPSLEKLGVKNPSDMKREDWNRLRELLHNQRLLGMDYYSGGHLTHGYRQNISSQLFDSYSYSVDRETSLLDYDEIERMAKEIRPLILLAGYSAYSRKINFKRMSEIAHSVGAVFMVDMAHFAGLVAGGVFSGDWDPVKWADVVTTTTHKTLRGPRGGMILCKSEFKESVDKGCPLVIGGPLPHVMNAKLIALREAESDEFKKYAAKIVENSSSLASSFIKRGVKVLTGGTDNHLMLLDVSEYGLNGRQAESVLRECGITLNRNALPFDKNGAWYTSGLRIGTAAVTTLGMGKDEMDEIASIITDVLSSARPAVIQKGEKKGEISRNRAHVEKSVKEDAKARVISLLERFPLYRELDLGYLERAFPYKGEQL